MAEFRDTFIPTETGIRVGAITGNIGVSATYQELGDGSGLPLILALGGLPANMFWLPTVTQSGFDPQKESELRRYLLGSPYGTRTEIPSGVNGNLSLDLVKNAAGNAYDPGIDVLERAAIEVGRLVFVQTMTPIAVLPSGKNRFQIRAASFTVQAQHPIDSNAKQLAATYALSSADAPIVGYFDV